MKSKVTRKTLEIEEVIEKLTTPELKSVYRFVNGNRNCTSVMENYSRERMEKLNHSSLQSISVLNNKYKKETKVYLDIDKCQYQVTSSLSSLIRGFKSEINRRESLYSLFTTSVN